MSKWVIWVCGCYGRVWHEVDAGKCLECGETIRRRVVA